MADELITLFGHTEVALVIFLEHRHSAGAPNMLAIPPQINAQSSM